jgi:hypothetical protein
MSDVKGELSQQVSESVLVDKASDDSEKTNITTYLIIGISIIAVILLLIFAYKKFIDNSDSEPFVKGLQQERDDPVMDFNLNEAIKELEGLQKKVLQKLSNDTGL